MKYFVTCFLALAAIGTSAQSPSVLSNEQLRTVLDLSCNCVTEEFANSPIGTLSAEYVNSNSTLSFERFAYQHMLNMSEAEIDTILDRIDRASMSQMDFSDCILEMPHPRLIAAYYGPETDQNVRAALQMKDRLCPIVAAQLKDHLMRMTPSDTMKMTLRALIECGTLQDTLADLENLMIDAIDVIVNAEYWSGDMADHLLMEALEIEDEDDAYDVYRLNELDFDLTDIYSSCSPGLFTDENFEQILDPKLFHILDTELQSYEDAELIRLYLKFNHYRWRGDSDNLTYFDL